MPQIFHRSTNAIARITILGAIFIAAIVTWLLVVIFRSDYLTEVRVVREQPVPFSHKHHVADDGLDCRYCHTSVETSSFAGLPPTETCMTCHSQIWADSPMLEPVRASFRNNTPLRWTKRRIRCETASARKKTAIEERSPMALHPVVSPSQRPRPFTAAPRYFPPSA